MASTAGTAEEAPEHRPRSAPPGHERPRSHEQHRHDQDRRAHPVEVGRADRHLGAGHRLGEEREDRAEEHGEAEGDQEHVVHQEHRLAREERVQLRALAEPVPAPHDERERRQQDRGQVGQEEGADRAAGERVDRGDHAAPREERPEDRQGEGERDQGQVPDLQHRAPFLDHDRVDERRPHQPGHERGVLHRIPRPVAAPAQGPVRPPAAVQDAGGEEEPGGDRPPARQREPGAVEPAGHERGHREGERHDEADVARVEEERVHEHVGDLEEGVRAPAPRGPARPAARTGWRSRSS